MNNVQAQLFPDLVPDRLVPSRRDHLTYKGNRDRGRHDWLRLTPAYSVHVVQNLIADCDQDDRVLDPFCGTGTTALVCAEAGIACRTIDINPFLVWLANAKCVLYAADHIAAAEAALDEIIARLEDARSDPWVPPIRDIHKWWDPPTLALLANAHASIARAELSQLSRDLLLVAFCRTIIELASVSFGHQSMSFKKTAAMPVLLAARPIERVRGCLRRSGQAILSAARVTPAGTDCRALLGDSRRLDAALAGERFTRVITSPPYPNRMSYIRELRPYMYWLGYLHTGRQAGELDWQAIGGTWGCATSNLLKWTPGEGIATPSETLHTAIEAISARSAVLGKYVTKYFCDLVPHLRSLRGVLAPSARVHYIVGNSKFYDVMLRTEQIYADLLRALGYQDVTIEVIRKRTSKRELFEYVVSARA